jgi:branched-chain amino acid aminotransferase
MQDPEMTSDVFELGVWKDGKVVAADRATVPVWDHGFLYGDGVFEGVRMRSRHLYRIHDHLDRLRRSAKMLGLGVLYTDNELLEALRILSSPSRSATLMSAF